MRDGSESPGPIPSPRPPRGQCLVECVHEVTKDFGGGNRATWDDYFCALALLISTRSPSEKLHVGCVMARDNRIISCGYNGFFSGLRHQSISREGREVNTIHAEVNAVTDAARRGVSLEGCTSYVTDMPCLDCTKCLLASGVRRVVYVREYRNDPLVAELCTHAGMALVQR